jgi:hypothetical protein
MSNSRIKEIIFSYGIQPVQQAFYSRLDYFAASKGRWLALGLSLALLATFLFMPVENLTGTRWAVFLQILAAYMVARLSSGVALYQHCQLEHHRGGGVLFATGSIDMEEEPDPMGFGSDGHT